MSEIVITGIDFIPDSVNNCLSEKENGQNKLFLSEMEIDGNTGLRRFLFDNNTRKIYHLPKGIDSVPMEVAYIEIPPMNILDREGYSEARSQQDKSKNIGSVEFDDYKFIGREIPFLTVLGVDFFVDTKNQEFTQLSNRGNKIDFSSVGLYDETDMFQMNYCTGIKNLARNSTDKNALKATINVPGLWYLDPVGLAIRTKGISGYKLTPTFKEYYNKHQRIFLRLNRPKPDRTIKSNSNGKSKRKP